VTVLVPDRQCTTVGKLSGEEPVAWAADNSGKIEKTYCPAATWSNGTRSSLPSWGVLRLFVSGFEAGMLMGGKD